MLIDCYFNKRLTNLSLLKFVLLLCSFLTLGESFVCVYANTTVVKAKPIQRGLQCPIPKSEVFAEYLSAGDSNKDTVQLDVRFATLDTPLVSTQVRLLDCSRESSCHDCTRHSECNWCMENNMCVAKSERSCYQVKIKLTNFTNTMGI